MITKDTVVAIHYRLTNKDGELIDESNPEQPLEYIHGHHNLIPGMEAGLEGRKAGDKFDIVIPAKDAYGEIDPEKVFAVDRSMLGEGEPKVGMMARLRTDDGYAIARIVKVTDKEVFFDANHELAGQELHFKVEVVSVRPGTEEEIAMGRLPHKCGGDCGDCGGCH